MFYQHFPRCHKFQVFLLARNTLPFYWNIHNRILRAFSQQSSSSNILDSRLINSKRQWLSLKVLLIMQGRLLNIFVLGIHKIERSCSTILRVKSYVNATVWKLFALLRSYAYQDTTYCTKWLLNMIVCWISYCNICIYHVNWIIIEYTFLSRAQNYFFKLIVTTSENDQSVNRIHSW